MSISISIAKECKTPLAIKVPGKIEGSITERAIDT
jgi:hypothetical protein